MTPNSVRNILDERLLTVPGLPELQKENIRHVVVVNQVWCRSTMLPAESSALTLGVTGKNMLRGLYQVDLFYPSGKGTDISSEMADLVITTFPRGLQLTNVDTIVHVEMSWLEVASHIDGIYQVPIVIRWRSEVNK